MTRGGTGVAHLQTMWTGYRFLYTVIFNIPSGGACFESGLRFLGLCCIRCFYAVSTSYCLFRHACVELAESAIPTTATGYSSLPPPQTPFYYGSADIHEDPTG